MRVILGIGNPGSQYERTRHNIAWPVLDALAARGAATAWRERFRSSACEVRLGEAQLLLLKPDTFVNHSGEAAQAALSFLKLPIGDLLVVTDDIALPFGQLRLRPGGSSGGHNGLRDIEARIGQAYARLRIGVDRQPPGFDQAAWVLGRFPPDQEARLPALTAAAADAVVSWARDGQAAACTINALAPP